eukprot:COSAG01_NODE_2764_length_7112_cov_593.144018_9_plen_74_part_00
MRPKTFALTIACILHTGGAVCLRTALFTEVGFYEACNNKLAAYSIHMSDDPTRILCVYTTCTMCALSHPILSC